MDRSHALTLATAVAVAALAGCSGTSNSGSACYPPEIALSAPASPTVRPGETLTLRGSHFADCQDQGEGLPTRGDQDITIALVGDETVTLEVVDAESDGTWVATVTVPETTPGVYEIKVPTGNANALTITVE